jgi:hypothetical protein
MQFEFRLVILMVLIAVFLFYFSQTKRPSVFIFAGTFSVLILIVSSILFNIGKEVYANYHQPPKWDFLCFWLYGKVALTGGNFYDVKNYQEMSLPYDPGDDFRKGEIDVGFKYPPFTMFLFLPLGLFSISRAYLLWQISNLLLCVACIYELWKIFLKDHGALGLLLVATLMLMLVPTRSTFYYAQTNFFVLLLFLMFWQNRSIEWGGIWLALCVVIKPYMALLYIYPLFTRKWKVLAIAISALLILTFLSIFAFGSNVFASFFNNPTSKVPILNYTEMVNQSLLATILRLSQYQIIKESPLLNPLYLGFSLLLTFITVWVTIIRKNSDDWVALSILFLALIVYPASLVHYGVFLIIPVVSLLQQSSKSTKKKIAVSFIILITYFLSGYNSGSYMFYANLFMWIVCIVLSVRSSVNNSIFPIANLESVA